MSKYQKALNEIKSSVVSIFLLNEYKTLQELVDRATPKKPRYRPSGNIKCWCGLQMYEEQQDWYRYCSNCGQKIDWSDEE